MVERRGVTGGMYDIDTTRFDFHGETGPVCGTGGACNTICNEYFIGDKTMLRKTVLRTAVFGLLFAAGGGGCLRASDGFRRVRIVVYRSDKGYGREQPEY
jgi:hypothetical protein